MRAVVNLDIIRNGEVVLTQNQEDFLSKLLL